MNSDPRKYLYWLVSLQTAVSLALYVSAGRFGSPDPDAKDGKKIVRWNKLLAALLREIDFELKDEIKARNSDS